jgi:hypothetical protein
VTDITEYLRDVKPVGIYYADGTLFYKVLPNRTKLFTEYQLYEEREALNSELGWLYDLLGEANALARIRAERIKEIESDPALEFCHRFAVLMECMVLSNKQDPYWAEAVTLLSDYHEADHKWREAMGEPYVSGFGKD